MTAEGWDGKSLRQHVESAEADAAAARELAEAAHDAVATLRAELAELAERCNCPSHGRPA
jgi:septal ring factor EnvC (AmiA/AmiB activator)